MRRLPLLLLGFALVACTPSETGQYGPATWALDPAADIQISDDTVMVTFGVVPLGGAQECQGNPPTAVTVRLPEPLGDRRLLDGGREPPAEPPTCANRESCQ